MRFFWQGLREAWGLILDRDPYLTHLMAVTLEVLAASTTVALVIGLPLGLALGLGRFRGRNVGVAIANAGLGLPPVVVGLVLLLVLQPEAPLGRLGILFTLRGVIIAQTFLAFPIITALTISSVRDLAPGLLDQARALGANRLQVWVLAAREARIGILAAIIAAVGSGLSEVGAVVLVGGNIRGYDQTLASATLENANGGTYAQAMAIAIILIGLIVLVSAGLTALQYGRGSAATLRAVR